MTFAAAVAQLQPPANGARQPGLQALGGHSRSIECADTRRITGSIDIDAVLRPLHPNASRWDYGVGWERGDREEAIWIEAHPAATSDVSKMIDKLMWLRTWLRDDAPALDRITRRDQPFYWLATKGVHIPKTSPQARRLAQSGLRFPSKTVQLR